MKFRLNMLGVKCAFKINVHSLAREVVFFLKKSHCDCFNIVCILAAEEEFQEVDDDIIDEEFNEKECEEGNSMFYNLLCYYM